ncbi:hypothetical protein WH47_07933 [Habropoda laboriosa]|uniref:Uncharacterized protein n=1 Tax=Habropoda laboriosa TaxID=597456 RepID=A0A0L7RIH1_9HYME|nr:hypothetical protein WH47_07933 [Habropoda laboriosa]
MDLVYVPEVMTYGFFRAPQYRDYEQPWNENYFNCGTFSNSNLNRLHLYNSSVYSNPDNVFISKKKITY